VTPLERWQEAVSLPRALTSVQRVLAVNMRIVFWVTLVPIVITTGVLIFAFFLVVGVVAISQDKTNELLNNGTAHPPLAKVWLHIPVLGQQYVVTQQLVLLSAALGAFAALNFATGILQDTATRAEFADHALEDARGAMGGLAYYMGGVVQLLRELNQADILKEIKGMEDMRQYLAFTQGGSPPGPGVGPSDGLPLIVAEGA
jgi:hypothetical protein